jgi:hypothetical protein
MYTRSQNLYAVIAGRAAALTFSDPESWKKNGKMRIESGKIILHFSIFHSQFSIHCVAASTMPPLRSAAAGTAISVKVRQNFELFSYFADKLIVQPDQRLGVSPQPDHAPLSNYAPPWRNSKVKPRSGFTPYRLLSSPTEKDRRPLRKSPAHRAPAPKARARYSSRRIREPR